MLTGFVLISDGWSDAQNRPLIYFMLVSPKRFKFVRVVDTSGHEKKCRKPKKLAEWVSDIDTEQLKAIAAEAKETSAVTEVHELLDIAQGVADDDDSAAMSESDAEGAADEVL